MMPDLINALYTLGVGMLTLGIFLFLLVIWMSIESRQMRRDLQIDDDEEDDGRPDQR